jgi:hypothetical protein
VCASVVVCVSVSVCVCVCAHACVRACVHAYVFRQRVARTVWCHLRLQHQTHARTLLSMVDATREPKSRWLRGNTSSWQLKPAPAPRVRSRPDAAAAAAAAASAAAAAGPPAPAGSAGLLPPPPPPLLLQAAATTRRGSQPRATHEKRRSCATSPNMRQRSCRLLYTTRPRAPAAAMSPPQGLTAACRSGQLAARYAAGSSTWCACRSEPLPAASEASRPPMPAAWKAAGPPPPPPLATASDTSSSRSAACGAPQQRWRARLW